MNNDASCAPGASNAAKGLVNHLSQGSVAGQFGSGSGSGSAAFAGGRQAKMVPQNNAEDFFAAQQRNRIQVAPHHHQMNMAIHSSHNQQTQFRNNDPQWSNEFANSFTKDPSSFEFEAALQRSMAMPQQRNQFSQPMPIQQEQYRPTFNPNTSMMMTRPQTSFQQPYLQTPLTAAPLQRHHDPTALDSEWTAQFDHFEQHQTADAKGKSTALPASSTTVHGDLDSMSKEFDNLDFDTAHSVSNKEFATWEDEFNALDFDATDMSEEDRQAMMKKMGDVWKELQSAEHSESAAKGMHNPWDGGYEDFLNESINGGPVVDPDPVSAPWKGYKFEPENPFLAYPDALAQGLRILESPGGSLSQAALAFEAAVQAAGNSENAEAWMLLGKVQAENEKEDAAIAALQRSVQLDPENLEALMALSISYTNESLELQAYATLNRWLSTKYPTIPSAPTPAPNTMTSAWELHESTTARFLQAVPLNNGTVDADLQMGLGVLFYNRSEYDKVIDCFGAALRVRSGDYLLWNRLGATLANSGRSEEAIEAYRKSLQLKPSFVRCRYNLGVSCINIGCYQEAAEHLLGALSLHVVGDKSDALGYVNVSENLWDTLRRCFVQMGRMELAEMTETGAGRDVDRFRKEFEF
ncbi:Peroxisomal membrane signal receptor PTS1 [Podochytrium sp. JEL0797]|nr:Peroxisomal membrane signal receptor PTS1 [Podochytrium sp. JEL0797]